MSINKYAKFFRESGFFLGSKIKTLVTDASFIGYELILAKDGNVIDSMTIPASGRVEFFTDESGTLTLSSDNGRNVLSGSVEVTTYATYNVTLNGIYSDTTRRVYVDDVTMTTDTAITNVAYTGDKSTISISNSNTGMVRATLEGNKIKLRETGNNIKGRCAITATVAATDKYNSGSKTFYVNKLTGIYGMWSDASDETITRMINEADAGDLDLSEFWTIGEERRVHLDAIEQGAEITKQPGQDLDLVLMHNPVGDSKYMLTTHTAGNRYQPNFIVGVKECLANKSALSAFTSTVTSGSSSDEYSNTSYATTDEDNACELLSMLNYDFVLALPQYIQSILKPTERRYLCNTTIDANIGTFDYDDISYKSIGAKSHRVSIVNLRELGFSSSIARSANSYDMPTGIGIYGASGRTWNKESDCPLATTINNVVNSTGTKFSYYYNHSVAKHKGIDGLETDYFTVDTMIEVNTSSRQNDHGMFSMAFYINESGQLTTNNLADIGTRTKTRGIAPIMFI